MSENSSSNVASVAIVVLVLVAAAVLYLFVIRGGGESAPDGPDVELQIGGESGDASN